MLLREMFKNEKESLYMKTKDSGVVDGPSFSEAQKNKWGTAVQEVKNAKNDLAFAQLFEEHDGSGPIKKAENALKAAKENLYKIEKELGIKITDSIASELLDDIMDFAGLNTDDSKAKDYNWKDDIADDIAELVRRGKSPLAAFISVCKGKNLEGAKNLDARKQVADILQAKHKINVDLNAVNKKFEDTKSIDGKIYTVGNYEIEIMDNTHLKFRLKGTEGWAIPLHFNQVPDDMIEGLKKQGLVERKFFKDSMTCDSKIGNITFGGKGYRCSKCGATADAVHNIKHRS